MFHTFLSKVVSVRLIFLVFRFIVFFVCVGLFSSSLSGHLLCRSYVAFLENGFVVFSGVAVEQW